MDFTTVTLEAAGKAMSDVVIPAAVASGQLQAVEQAHLVRDAIDFVKARVDLVGDRRRYEALSRIEIAALLLDEPELAGESSRAALDAAVSTSRRVVADPGSSQCEYSATNDVLGEAITSMLTTMGRITDSTRSRLEKWVLGCAMKNLELDRSWLCPMGFDPEPDTVRPLEVLLLQKESSASAR